MIVNGRRMKGMVKGREGREDEEQVESEGQVEWNKAGEEGGKKRGKKSEK